MWAHIAGTMEEVLGQCQLPVLLSYQIILNFKIYVSLDLLHSPRTQF